MIQRLTGDVADKLLQAAESARQRAYVPYSNFAVGAALLTGSGLVYPGCNIENASYSLAICAERAAVAGAVISGEKKFCILAVVADTRRPIVPCGSCLQVLVEFSEDLILLLGNLHGERRFVQLRDLLPESFDFSPGDN